MPKTVSMGTRQPLAILVSANEQDGYLIIASIAECDEIHRRRSLSRDGSQWRRHYHVPQRRQQQLVAIDDCCCAAAAHSWILAVVHLRTGTWPMLLLVTRKRLNKVMWWGVALKAKESNLAFRHLPV